MSVKKRREKEIRKGKGENRGKCREAGGGEKRRKERRGRKLRKCPSFLFFLFYFLFLFLFPFFN
jgi:hypothetical protein